MKSCDKVATKRVGSSPVQDCIMQNLLLGE